MNRSREHKKINMIFRHHSSLWALQKHTRGIYEVSYSKSRYISTTVLKRRAITMTYNSYPSNTSSSSKNLLPIVIMHGLFGSKMNWKSLAKAISQRTNRHVYAVDARNHGDSPHTPDLDYSLLGEDLINFLKEQSIEKAILMGHSMGGRAVMAAAFLQPSLVSSLFVLDMSPIGMSPSISSLPRYVEYMKRVTVPSELNTADARKYVDNFLQPAIPEAGIRQFLLSSLVKGKDGFRWRFNLQAIGDCFNPHIVNFPLVEEGYKYYGKTVFVGGALSDYLRPSIEPEIRRIFPSSSFHYIEGAGHWLHADKPQEFLNTIVPIIDTLE
ncbi:unnamed protein product [Meganyctiphanes norvegica]|uniref:sn-1-specific diacylglycerol lipase ABHD11 n=1 Tax=Meganyctiphanes norvegica TaxID=48144 RepID=A0AAV2S2N4_MEGNR